jgi:hypothetical protein
MRKTIEIYKHVWWDSIKRDMRHPTFKATAATTYGKLSAIEQINDLENEIDLELTAMCNQARFWVFDYAPRHKLFWS